MQKNFGIFVHFIRFSFVFCLSLLAFEKNLFADDIAPPPEEIVSRARVSRSEMSDVVFELRAAIPDLKTKERIGPYLKILDELRVIQVELKFSSMDTDMISDLADRMTMFVEPQLDISEDPDWLLVEFSRWSQDLTRMQFAVNQERIVSQTSGIEKIFLMHDRMGTVIEALQKPLPMTQSVLPSTDDFARIQARLHQKLIDSHLDELSMVDYVKFLSKVHRASVVQGVFETFQRLSYVRSDEASLAKILEMLVRIRSRLGQLKEFVPEDVSMRPGMIAEAIIMKIAGIGGTIEGSIVADSVKIMEPTHVDALGAGLRGLDLSRQRPSQFNFLAELASDISNRYGGFGMLSQQKAMQHLSDYFALGAAVHEKDLEGIYEINIEGRPGILSVARSDNMGVVVAVGYEHITASMAYSTFDAMTGMIHSSSVLETATPTDSSTGQQEIPVQYARFLISSGPSGSDDLSVKGVLRIGHREQNFSGRRVNRLTNYLDLTSDEPVPLSEFEGTYEGRFLGYDAALKVSKNGPTYVASVMLSPKVQKHLISLDLVFLHPETGVIYLTSRQRAVFFQVRGIHERGKITGQYIIGGRRNPVDVTFVKVSDDSSDN